MKTVKIGDAEPGMELAADVAGPNGRLLAPRGAILTEKTLRVLNIWGVAEISILGADPAGAAGSDDPGQTDDGEEAGPDPEALRQAAILARPWFEGAEAEFGPMAELMRQRVLDIAARGDHPPPPPPKSAPEPEAPPRDPAALLTTDADLTSFPDVFFELRGALENPQSSFTHIADVIGRDPALTARLLRLANSPFYGFSTRIDSLSRAVMLIGANELTQLVIGVSVMGVFKAPGQNILCVSDLWKYALGCGAFARVIGARIPGLSQERCFVAGLIQVVGRLILLKRLPGLMAQTLAMAAQDKIPLIQAERRIFGFAAADVSRAALTAWKLPPSLCEAAGGLHDPARLAADPYARVVHAADVAAVSQGLGYCGSPYVPPLNRKAWELMELPDSFLSLACSQARRLFRDLVSIFPGEG